MSPDGPRPMTPTARHISQPANTTRTAKEQTRMADETPVVPREIVPAGTTVVREGFNSKELVTEAAAPVGIGFREQLEAAMILAQRRPRSLDKFRLRLLDYCEDP